MRGFTGIVLACLLAGCDGDGAKKNEQAVALPTIAETSDIGFDGGEKGPTPFIYRVHLSGRRIPAVKTVSCTIEPKPGSTSKAVRISYTRGALQARGAYPDKSRLQFPVFGLYAGYENQLTVSLGFADGSTQTIPISLTTDAYIDPNGVYTAPTFVRRRTAGADLGFDFIALKANISPPLIIDTDGEIRWVGTGTPQGFSSAIWGNGFVVGDPRAGIIYRLGLDGSVDSSPLAASNYVRFHHNVDPGKHGFLGEFDTATDVESTIAEFQADGSILKEWDMAAIISGFMSAQGDDPALFVRRGADWFHSNSTTYDPRDDSLLVSSRENFVVKLDYETGRIVWLFGDPTKYWAMFPSLRTKAITLAPGGLMPLGQHGLSITRDGLLMLFNNGYPSVNQPAGAPVGDSRIYSAVSAYRIDDATLTATEEWHFDYDQSVRTLICSSAYEATDRSLLVNYAWVEFGRHARVVGLNPQHQVVFDFQFDNTKGGCDASWNALPIALENVVYQ